MWSIKPVVVEILFGSVDDLGHGCRMPLYKWAAMVSEQGVCVHLAMTGEKRDDVVPDSSRKQDWMQQEHWRFVMGHDEVWHRRRTANRVFDRSFHGKAARPGQPPSRLAAECISATRARTMRGPFRSLLRGNGEYVPLAGHAFEFVSAAVVELEPRPNHEVAQRT